jgi:glycosyltransferase involved in cell wall biosynthesis
MKVSFVIPVYNNSASLVALSNALVELSNRMQWMYEIVLVDDCSKDNSLQIAKQLSSNTTIIHLKKNQGQSTALLIGIKYATGTILVSLDADLQDDPNFIPSLIEKITPQNPIVFSGRGGKYEKQSKLISAIGFKYVLHILSFKRLPKNACLFFAMHQSVIPHLTPYIGSNPYLLSLIAKSKVKCDSVPYIRKHNQFGKGSYTFKKRWKVATKGIANFFFLKKKEIDPTLFSIIKNAS